MLIRITDDHEGDDNRTQAFLEGRYTVLSRSGLSDTEIHLINALPGLQKPERLLVLGNRTGAVALIAADLYPGLQTVVSSIDCYHHHAVERNLKRNDPATVMSRCEPDIVERDHYDAVLLQVSKGSMADELILDLLQQSHLALKTGGRCLVAVDENGPWVTDQIKKCFGRCSILDGLLSAQKQGPLKKLKDYLATFTMTVPKGKAVTLSTRPGVFAHRRVDEGAQALAETATTEPGDVILDMGCGCGSIGLSLAVNQPTASVCFLDSSSRALAVTEANCRANDVTAASFVLSDEGVHDKDRFSLFVGNPPYYSNDRISTLFIRTAHRTLRSGGRAYIVAKNASRNLELMHELFANAELLHRRGYQIVKSVKI